MRFFRMAAKYGINATEVRRFFTLYENLYFPGKAGPQRYALTSVQAFQFTNIYGFWHNGRRVVREVALYVPRKFSKTTSSASLAVDDLLYGDANAESYTGANSNDQAKKCFDVIRGCVRKLDPKERRYTVNEQTIKSRRKDRTAFAQCLTANARTKDGLNASTVIMDEFSQARDNSLLTVLTTSMGVRENPLTVIITTASDVFDGPFYEMLQGYKSVISTLKGAKSVRAASDAVLLGFEKPADQSEAVQRKRAEYGEAYYKKYAGGQQAAVPQEKPQAAAGVPFKVKVDILDLNIRTGAGTDYAKTGEHTGKGVFTITEVKAGKGSTAGWGKLKSGAGWISLDYATRLA